MQHPGALHVQSGFWPKIKTGKLSLISIFPLLWCGAGLNRRHKDFQSFALPTELPHQFEYPILNKECKISIWAAKIRDSFKY